MIGVDWVYLFAAVYLLFGFVLLVWVVRALVGLSDIKPGPEESAAPEPPPGSSGGWDRSFASLRTPRRAMPFDAHRAKSQARIKQVERQMDRRVWP